MGSELNNHSHIPIYLRQEVNMDVSVRVCLSERQLVSSVLIREFVGLMNIAQGQIDYILVKFE